MHGIQESLIDQDNNAVRVDIITGGSGGGGTVTVPNPIGVSGAVLGTVSDAAAEGDVSGSINAHLRAVSKILADVHNEIGHELRTSPVDSVDQGTGNAGSSPWAVSGSVTATIQGTPAVTVSNQPTFNQGTGNAGASPWAVSGSVTVINAASNNQGTGNAGSSPWAVSGTVSVIGPHSVSLSGVITGVTLSDAVPNPTTAIIGSCTMGWDTTNWERCTLINGSADARGNVASVGLVQHGFNYVYNGVNWDRLRGNTNGGFVQGPGASGSIFVGNPVLFAGADAGAVTRTLLLNDDGSQPVGGFTKNVSTTIQRPNNSVTYTANTAIANATGSATQLTFTNCARKNGYTGLITSVFMVDCQKATTLGQFELWLYDTSIGTVISDNATWAPVSGDLQNLVGIVPLNLSYVGNTGAGAVGNVVFEAPNLNIPYKCGAASTSLFGQLVVRNAYVPIPLELFIIRLQLSQD
jgi:hypothetical protein